MSAPSPFVEFSAANLELSVPACFEREAARHRERLAVTSERHALTYGDLNEAANRLARMVLALRGPDPGPVALLLGHDALAVVAIMAALKAGKTYVLLDPRTIPSHLNALLRDAGPSLLITSPDYLGLARQLLPAGVDLLDVGAIDPEVSAEDLGMHVPPHVPAVISYTSGSTGEPKGVVSCHRDVLHRMMTYVNVVRARPGDRLSVLHGLSTTGYRNLFGALLTGATACLYDLRQGGLTALATWIGRERITICHAAASVFRHVAATVPEGGYPALRVMWLGAEPVVPTDVELYRSRLPDTCILINGLSTTETGTVCHFVMDKATPVPDDVVPVGYPARDKEVLLLDEDGHDVGMDRVGEIAVRSEYLADGYWQRHDLTAKAFLPDPAGGTARLYRTGDLGRRLSDGRLVHAGRKDASPKLRGLFVDIRAVETMLLGHPGIRDAVVSIREDQPEEPRLVAYLVAAEGAAPTVNTLRRALGEALPAHMVPTVFVYLQALPRTPNGKVDRSALPIPDGQRLTTGSTYTRPRTPIEETLARIWVEVLLVDSVGVDDEFMDLGGDSLRAARIINRVRQVFGLDAPGARLLDARTVAQMAVAIVEHLLSSGDLE